MSNSQRKLSNNRRSQLTISIEDSMDLGAVCETPSSSKTPIRQAFEQIENSTNFDDLLDHHDEESQKASPKKVNNVVEIDDGDDGEIEFSFSQLDSEEEEKPVNTNTKKQTQSSSKNSKSNIDTSSSPVLYSSESDAPASSSKKSTTKSKYQATQEQHHSTQSDSEKAKKSKAQSSSSPNKKYDFSQYLTPDEGDEDIQNASSGYALRKTPTRKYQEKKKRKKIAKQKKEILISDSEDEQVTIVTSPKEDKMYDSDEIPDEDIDAMEEQLKSRRKRSDETEEERRERELNQEKKKKKELDLRKKRLSDLSNSIRKKNQHKSIYIEDDNCTNDIFSNGKRKGTFDEGIFSQESSQEEKEVFSSPKKRLKKKSGSPIGSSSPIRFDREDGDEGDSEELEDLAREIRENNLLLSANKKNKKSLKFTVEKRAVSSSEDESPPRRKKKSKKRDESEDEIDEVTMSQFIVSDSEEVPDYDVYRAVDMMNEDIDSQEFMSVLTSNTRLSTDVKSSFANYIQFITSHLLDEDFIKSLKLKDRTQFANASKMIEGKLETVKDSLVYSSAWKVRHKNLLQYYPIIKAREISLKDVELDHEKSCQACGRKNHAAEYTLIFKSPRATTKYEFSSGATINWIDSPDEVSDEEETDYIQLSQRRAVRTKKSKYKEKSFVGSTCYKRSLLYHSFQHYKFHLIQHIIHKIDKIASTFEGEDEITSDYILEKIVSKKSWTDSLYKKYLKLIEEAEASYTKTKDAGVIDVVDELFDVYDSEEEVTHNSDPDENDTGFVVSTTRGGLRLKRTKAKSNESEEEDQEDPELIDEETSEKENSSPKNTKKKSTKADDHGLDFDEEEEPPKPSSPEKDLKKKDFLDLSGCLDSSDDDILNYKI